MLFYTTEREIFFEKTIILSKIQRETKKKLYIDKLQRLTTLCNNQYLSNGQKERVKTLMLYI